MIKKECLAVVTAIIKFGSYLYRKPFSVVKDQKFIRLLGRFREPFRRLASISI